MIKDMITDAETRMKKSVEAFQHELGKIRTGRANPSLLQELLVDYYDTPTPLNQVASVNAQDARTLTITPWEKSMVSVIEKAIMNADLGLNPICVGDVLRVPMPALTEERRKELIKVVRQVGEQARIAIRNIRRDSNAQVKDLLKDKSLTEDEARHAEENTQKLTDKHIKQIDDLLLVKEKDLLVI